jgi:hypothetical protein
MTIMETSIFPVIIVLFLDAYFGLTDMILWRMTIFSACNGFQLLPELLPEKKCTQPLVAMTRDILFKLE